MNEIIEELINKYEKNKLLLNTDQLRILVDFWKEQFDYVDHENDRLEKIDIEKDEKIKLLNKQIDLMAEYIGKEDVSETFCENNEACDEKCSRCVKQYFEEKAKEA